MEKTEYKKPEFNIIPLSKNDVICSSCASDGCPQNYCRVDCVGVCTSFCTGLCQSFW